jgi:hypothetical protein
MKKHILVLLGAFAGGLVGYFGFLWIARQGFYALVLPGGLLGVGASLFRNKSTGICPLRASGTGARPFGGMAVCAVHQGREFRVFSDTHSPTQADHAHHARSGCVHRLLGPFQSSST